MTDFPGARWWRCDFHNHSPASFDVPDKSTTPEQWLLAYAHAGVDCVAVTDHNSGAWIEPLQQALSALEVNGSLRPGQLHLFPGVEITANQGVHVLALFDPGTPATRISQLLGAVRYRGTEGDSDAVTEASVDQVVCEIAQLGGIAVPAHVDVKKGLFTQITDAMTLQGLAKRCGHELLALHVCDPSAAVLQRVPDEFGALARLAASDSHDLSRAGQSSTWIKMGRPSLDSLKLALLDPGDAVERFDPGAPGKNRVPALWLGELRASDLRLRRNPSDGPLTMRFNPWFNAIIGGRGTGKSSIIELLRIVLRREDELRGRSEGPLRQVADTFDRFAKPDDQKGNGALLPATALGLDLSKDDARLRVRWAQSSGLQGVEEYDGGAWSAVPEQISDEYVRARFPAIILSQKQIFALAEQRGFLLELIDRAPEVDRDAWARHYEAARQRFFSLRAQARQLMPDLSNRPNVEAELRETERKLKALELSHHADSLKRFQRAMRQISAQQTLIQQWQRDLKVLQDAVADPDLFVRARFDGFDPADAEEGQFLAVVDQLEGSMRAEYLQIQHGIGRLQETLNGAQAHFDALPLQAKIASAQEAYSALLSALKEQGVDSPDQYAGLVARKQDLQSKLTRLDERLEEQRGYEAAAEEALVELTTLRREITEKRSKFVESINQSVSDRIRLSISCYGSAAEAVIRFRELIKQPSAFASDILESVDGGVQRGVLSRLYAASATDFEDELATLKKEILAMRGSPSRHTDLLGEAIHGKLRQHIETKLSDTDIDDLLAWFPDDGLDLSFRQQGSWRAVGGASAGQKSAAVLALLLSFGDEPLIVDQPEDDLDNAMVMELVVDQIRRNKSRRQLIIVTHNPNVVVNGDAEWVSPMRFRKGQIEIELDGVGAVSERGTRKAICRIMEGGERALRMRYKKMLEELA
ncbi:TrlF family AAA-like ATPase [Silanimonas sp.]|jgi:energy-coupling factor transporter ATP-binding protein EcfA2|uniref:TrlF family AAA-like ATPase n=1 Tax=Silanimonas sp. TaxID=1929290 RepID=UPI0037C900CF